MLSNNVGRLNNISFSIIEINIDKRALLVEHKDTR